MQSLDEINAEILMLKNKIQETRIKELEQMVEISIKALEKNLESKNYESRSLEEITREIVGILKHTLTKEGL